MSMKLNSVISGITTQQTGYATKVNGKDQDATGKNEKTGNSSEGVIYEKGRVEQKATPHLLSCPLLLHAVCLFHAPVPHNSGHRRDCPLRA